MNIILMILEFNVKLFIIGRSTLLYNWIVDNCFKNTPDYILCVFMFRIFSFRQTKIANSLKYKFIILFKFLPRHVVWRHCSVTKYEFLCSFSAARGIGLCFVEGKIPHNNAIEYEMNYFTFLCQCFKNNKYHNCQSSPDN